MTVSALTKYIKRKLSSDPHLKEVWLKGEISNFKHHSRGHMYFSIKDQQARIQAVMFAGANRNLSFTPENGMNVVLRGDVNVYEPMGQYQLYVQDMQPDGIGALFLAFEQLKEKLAKEGLFAEGIKRPLPPFPKRIAVVTSPTGAAVRDILTTIKRRYPLAKVTVVPVLVQGAQAASSIVEGIQYVNRMDTFDVMIVGRGGGSIEDLWNFNEEVVARAIHASRVPVISAVGHETDITISDFVADVRAATPTGAGELAVPSKEELLRSVGLLQQRMDRTMKQHVREAKESLSRLQKSYAFRFPAQLMRQKEQDLDRIMERLWQQYRFSHTQQRERLFNLSKRFGQQHPGKQVQLYHQQLERNRHQLNKATAQQVETKKNHFTSLLEKLSLLSPLDTMKRGFAIPYSEQGHVIKHIHQVHPGDAVSLKMQGGTLDCQVWGIEEENDE
nr:exodeoxyribonuclease VII large subunit [Thalassobacillus sp. CUG 92003]